MLFWQTNIAVLFFSILFGFIFILSSKSKPNGARGGAVG